jgi:hypothetical protein
VSGGDLDISIWISTPTNRVIAHHQRKVTGQPKFRTDEYGDYRICFDNSFSRFASKQIHFYIGTHNNPNFFDPLFNVDPNQNNPLKLDRDQLGELDDKIDNFMDTFTRVHDRLEKAKTHIEAFKAYELIDREVMEQNFVRINYFSVISIVLMLIVGAIQTFMIRSLFEDRSIIGKALRGKSSSDEKRRINF